MLLALLKIGTFAPIPINCWNGILDFSLAARTPTPPPPPSPCKDLSFDPNSGTIHCEWNFQWELQAGVSMPPIVIDARPYPVTLVKWPTAMRVNALTNASGSGTLAYAGWGGGTPSSPAVGDWRDITLTLTFRPSGSPVSVTLMKQASLTAPSSGGPIKTFTWEVPSHPAVGATKTAGAVGQLGEIPSDIPLFEGHARTTYRLFYNLSYQERSKHYVCYAQLQCRTRWAPLAQAAQMVNGYTAGMESPRVAKSYPARWQICRLR